MTTAERVDSIERAVQKAYAWVDEVAAQLGEGATRRQAYSVLRGMLQTLRDRLPVDEAADLAAQLPELIRGVYYEGWDPSKVPHKLSREEFLARFTRAASLPPHMDPEAALHAAMHVVRSHVTPGEVEDVAQMLPAEVRDALGV